ncbi:MAG: hypothetical protein JRN06_04750 [Nitrososphaerota archaeon]|nr:hypothetical protein [Nitrososphaerota archaeon]MDG7023927.1 hypothetical protein [Nitrososphaerota archaeon]
MPKSKRPVGFKEYVGADLNRDALYGGVKAMALAGVLALVFGNALGFLPLEYSGMIFLPLATVFLAFLARWYLGALQYEKRNRKGWHDSSGAPERPTPG